MNLYCKIGFVELLWNVFLLQLQFQNQWLAFEDFNNGFETILLEQTTNINKQMNEEKEREKKRNERTNKRMSK